MLINNKKKLLVISNLSFKMLIMLFLMTELNIFCAATIIDDEPTEQELILQEKIKELKTNKEEELVIAASNGNSPKLRELLASGVNVNARDKYGNSALILAANHGNKDIAKLLIDANADVNAIGEEGRTALMEASRFREIEIVRLLLNAGAELDAKDKSGRKAINFASLISPSAYTPTALKKQKEDIAKILNLFEEERKKREHVSIVKRKAAIKQAIEESNKLLPVIAPMISEYAVSDIGDVPVSERQL